jgi:hypothetical protein
MPCCSAAEIMVAPDAAECATNPLRVYAAAAGDLWGPASASVFGSTREWPGHSSG